MTKPITGGCLCGYIRYFCDGEIGPAGYCHCADCRRTSGSAFGISVRVEAASFHLTNGEVKGFTKAGESGRLVTRYFCPECGSPIYTAPPLHPDVYFIKAGSLDDPSLIKPNRQAWTRSRVGWSAIDPDLLSFETNRP